MKKTLSLLGALLIVICLSSVRAAADGTVLSPQKLTAEGRSAECEMYNIGGSNYMKLRDAAFLLSGTVSRFSVERDESTGALSVFTGRPYVPDGSELDLSAGDRSASAVPCAVTVTIDGIARDDLSAYDIGGSSFFRLRDLGGCLGFFVSYDRDCDTVIVKSLADVKNPDPWLPGAEYELGAGRVSATVNTYDPGGVLIKTEYAEQSHSFREAGDRGSPRRTSQERPERRAGGLSRHQRRAGYRASP